MAQTIDKDHHEFIQTKVNPILESLVTHILLERPDKPVPHMIKWLVENRPDADKHKAPATTASEPQTVDELKAEIQKLKSTVQGLEEMSGMMESAQGPRSPVPGEEEEEEEEEDDVADDDMPAPPPSYASRGPRASVSAEAYGAWNQKKEFVPPSFPKTEEQTKRLRTVLAKSFLFAALDEKDLSLVVGAMQESVLEPGKRVIQEGDDGECLYVVEKGTMDCYKKIQGEEKMVKVCNEGDAFGELALLYNCPRAASVQSRDAATLWSLDRETFNAIVKDAAAKKREMYEKFLTSVPLLESLSKYERDQLADALHQDAFSANAKIVKQGDPGDKFFMIERGECVAVKVFDGSTEEKEVMQYKVGDYFGELALLKNEPRAATILAKTDCKVLSIDRRTFKGLLGPLEEMLKRNVAKYQ